MKKISVVVFFLSSLFFVYEKLEAQHPVYYTISNNEGLPSNEVYQILQDNFGYIWIGSDAGLYKYDGFKFIPYVNSKQNGKSISFLTKDSYDRIWCKNFYGQIYRVEGDSLRLIYNKKISEPSKPYFSIDNQNQLWLTDNRSVYIYSDKGDSLRFFEIARDSSLGEIKEIYHSKNNIYFSFETGGIGYTDANGQNLQMLKDLSMPKDAFVSKSEIIESDGNLFWFSEWQSQNREYYVYKIGAKLKEMYHSFAIDGKERIHSININNNQLWANSSNGSFLIGGDSEPNAYDTLFKGIPVSWQFVDREGLTWFSTLNKGIFVVPDMKIRFITSNIGSTIVKIIAYDKSNLVFGSYNGDVYQYSIEKNLVKKIYTDPLKKFINVKSIKFYPPYLIVARGKLCIINTKTGETCYPPFSNIRDLTLVNDTLYMVNPVRGIKISLKDCYKWTDGRPEYLFNGGREVEFDEANNRMLFSVEDKILSYSNQQLKDFKINDENVTASCLSYDDGMMWIGTLNQGLFGMLGDKLAYHIYKDHGIKENHIRLVESSLNYVWIITNQSIYRISKQTQIITEFGGGLLGSPADVLDIEIVSGQVYLATNHGTLCFHENIATHSDITPNIKFTTVTVNGIKYDEGRALKLDYTNKNISIHFSSTLFGNKNVFDYRYRISGLNNHWTYVSSSTPYVNFPQLPPGEYRFDVQAYHSNGKNSSIISLPIIVTSPFWLKWWFYAFAFIALTLLLVFVFYSRLRVLKRRSELKQNLIQSQLTALKSQMNPHFFFNTLNSLQDLILLKDLKQTNYYLGKFSTLMRMVLNVSEKNEISLREEIELLDIYLELEKLRFGDEFLYEINASKITNQHEITIPPLLLQPFVENAIKHGLLHKKGDKKLTIEFEYDNHLICVITDNGVGRTKSAEINNRQQRGHKSFATGATIKRIDLLNKFHNKDFKIEIIDLGNTTNPQGTKVLIHIPQSGF